VGALLVAGCGTSTLASPSQAATSVLNAAPTHVLTASSSSSPVAVAPTVPAPPLGTAGKIIFSRRDGVTWPIPTFMIDPDGSHETALHDGGLLPGFWSPDGMRLAAPHLVTDQSPQPGAETEWIRPAVVNADGSGFKVLDAYPDRKMHLNPIAWSRDGSRIFVFSGSDAVDAASVGLYSVRSSDGGDLSSVLMAPPGNKDSVQFSPDGSKLLVNRWREVDPMLFVINVDGTGRRQLNPPGVVPVDLEFWVPRVGHASPRRGRPTDSRSPSPAQ
jgi:dipeptidyl aminopeptidase/acylaminoacyl peptidase